MRWFCRERENITASVFDFGTRHYFQTMEISSQLIAATRTLFAPNLRHALFVQGGSDTDVLIVSACTAVYAATVVNATSTRGCCSSTDTNSTSCILSPDQDCPIISNSNSINTTINNHHLSITGGSLPEINEVVVTLPNVQQVLLTTPEGISVLFCAIGMSMHYFGYAIARSLTVSLFTSTSTGYASNPAAFSLAMAFVSPLSLLLLMGYTTLLSWSGPRGALLQTTSLCALVFHFGAVAIASTLRSKRTLWGIPAVKFITGPLLVFRESYVQLLTSQYWSFMASILTPNQSARWFGPIAGLTSITSAVAGVTVSPVIQRLGIPGTLMGTGFMLLASLLPTSIAYQIAHKHGFEPKDQSSNSMPSKKTNEPKHGNEYQKMSLVHKATRLFQRAPILRSLFFEILASQGLATVLNVCFVDRLATAIPDDNERAIWVGQYYSVINAVTMILQFGVLPPLMAFIEPRDLWRVIPLVTLLFTGLQVLRRDPSLYVVAASLMVMKVSEYSARRMLDEMIYVPLDFESRFVGKEVLGVFGYRFGKSFMSLLLSGLTALDSNFGIRRLSILANVVCFSWMRTAWNVSNMVPTRAEAEVAHKLLQTKTNY